MVFVRTTLSHNASFSCTIGCTYIGPGGLDFVQRLVKAGGQVRVPTTLNSVSTDRRRWQALGVPVDYANNAIALGDAYLELQCQPSFTCAPYLLSNAPELGQDLVWGESNAVVYANSVLGARTEKYADYLDICCAIAGIVPAMGVHLDVNRKPAVVLDATEVISVVREHLGTNGGSDWDILFPTLGHLCGTMADGKVPILVGLEDWTEQVTLDALKAFCAAYGTTGSSPLIHIAGITPEAKDPAVIEDLLASCGGNVRTLSMGQLEETFRTLDSDAGADNTVDMVALGNPHLSVSECQQLVDLVEDGSYSQKDPNVRIIACMSRALHSEAQDLGHIKRLEQFGMEFINDTCWCMLLDPPVIPDNPNARILTNSGKYAHYGPGLTQRGFRFGSMADCVRAAATGVYDKQPVHTGESAMPSWLVGSRTQASQRRSFAVSAVRSLRPFLKIFRR
jgi:predicted aconitase